MIRRLGAVWRFKDRLKKHLTKRKKEGYAYFIGGNAIKKISRPKVALTIYAASRSSSFANGMYAAISLQLGRHCYVNVRRASGRGDNIRGEPRGYYIYAYYMML